ncbi:MAG: phytanoyl-CoA dioxygenase family protein [Pseudomonadota bacterium]|nr:phytanoyl-CoA dioxygenase family protein [Pseudomonadota bacterium]
MPLPREQIKTAREHLLEDGFCILDSALESPFLAELRDWSDDLLRNTKLSPKWKYQGSDIHISGIRHRSKRSPELPGDEIVDRLIEYPAEILKALNLDDHRSGGTFQIISKPPNSPPLYWHQDWARWDDPISMSPWPQQIFLNWYLCDTNTTNGCLRVIPRSHRQRNELHARLVAPHEGGGYDIEEENEWMFFDHPKAVDVPVEAGQLLIGDARMLHGTHHNASSQKRTVLLGWYYRRTNDVPNEWRGDIPEEIIDRDPDLPFKWNREPGRYLT